jgi:taurine transport system permease protein
MTDGDRSMTTQAPPRAVPRRRRSQVESFWRREPRKVTALLISLASAVLIIALWAWATRPGGAISPLFLPPPSDVLEAAVRLIERPYLGTTLGGHVLASLGTVLIGWLVAGLVGVPLGIWIGWSKKARWTVYPVFQLLRPIPPIAWIPLALMWFGIGDPSRIFVVFVAAIVPWTLNSIQAVNSVDPILIKASRALGADQTTTLRRVVVPTAVPTLLAGAQIALGNAWTTVIAAELLGAGSGLGYIALNSSRTLDTDILLVSMFTIGLIGAALSLLMRWAVRVLSPGSVK